MTLRHHLATLFLMLGAVAASPAAAATPVSEIVVDAGTGRTLYAAQATRRRPPASLTKMMTLLLTFEAIDAGKLRLDGSITMSRRAARQAPSKLGLAAGRTISVRAAMRTVAVISANDVAVALAERIAGSEPAFVRAMNRRARQLGMTGTRFDNASGLGPTGGMTTARDMATLARYIVRSHPARYTMFAARSIRWDGRTRPNHNRLLGRVRGVDGVKTGYTVPAGYNLAASSRRGGRRVIVVVLGARTAEARDLLVSNLLESGFSSPRVRRGR
ncbi:D-alanyl-D-alanine carboxypeptidase family protein [Sphingomonas adhaesiva]|uniref:D-alanyl-D-alanine carboxypeptidase family protein n=1 Tax=Sphingomonas adhaesiva TaxID=28212 RepID=UPI002FF95EE5